VRSFAIILAVLSLLGCQNETNDRLARVEKKLDQIQQQPAHVPDQPNPALTTAPAAPPSSPAAFTPYMVVDRAVAVIIANNPVGKGRFVPTKDGPEYGYVQHADDGTSILFRLHEPTSQYIRVAVVPDILDADGNVAISGEKMANMRSLLEKR
jgi:hypothetical protein